MKKFKRFIAVMALATVAISVVGCSDTKAGQAEDKTQTTEAKEQGAEATAPYYSEYE